MELGSVVSFFEGKTILITGAAGFISKVFLEKVLRVQPNVNKIYLLLRARDSDSAALRFQKEIIAKDLFRVLMEKWEEGLSSFISDKISLVVGDTSAGEDLGINDSSLREEIYDSVDFVINLAANTTFDERYDVAFGVNTMGAINVLDFAGKCIKLQALVHVSTAYVAGEKSGVITETPHQMGISLNGYPGLDVDKEKMIISETLNNLQSRGATSDEIKRTMKDLGLERARSYGWPNTYVFTKAMGEMLVEKHRGTMSVAVVRPTIVTSTYREPFPGWIEGMRTIDTLAVGYGKGRVTCFLGDLDANVDLIPADMVVNAMLVIMASHARQPHARIYHVGSSARNPINFSRLWSFGYGYFASNPWIGKDGKPVIVKKVKVLGSMESFHMFMMIRFEIPLKILKITKVMLGGMLERPYDDLKRKIRFVRKVAELYRPYVFCDRIFDGTNTDNLRAATRNQLAEDTIYFEPKCINWEEYFLTTHAPGVVKYVF